ncbi:apolipoprotein N-acyltransferase [Desulfosudis oleivorans Hxd3]|uniref:Apolipoprotein N-acyltransferase n=1 Tax=Desulfosudis oleivorans (strain DSM 6200 / JCM 39069 / Hxd3) TaxID=96561 RepID=A8ZZQ9_DESOH|nr:apolipoprotein N-acyltransferase [Desulfosudis oleivorans Hxd3]
MTTSKKRKQPVSGAGTEKGSLLKPVLLVCLAALLQVLAFPRAGLWILAWVQAIPFWYAISRAGTKKAFLLGWLYGALISIGVSYWVFYALYVYSNAGFIVSLLFLLVVNGALIGIFWALYGATANRVLRLCPSPFIRAVGLAGLWVVMEYGRANLLGGMPWCLLGHSQYRVPQLIQVADIAGVYGLSFLIIFTSYTLYSACTCLPDKRMCGRRVLPALVAVLAVVVYGSIRLGQYAPNPQESAAGSPATVAVIQGSTAQDEKWEKKNTDDIMSRHLRMTEEALAKGARLIIWPETTIPFYLQDKMPEGLLNLLRTYDAGLITGGFRYSGTKNNYTFYNSAFYVDGNGIRAYHDKLHLLPFGEFFPLGFIDVLKLRYAAPRQYTAGTAYTLFDTAAGTCGSLICFEVIYPRLAREFVNRGADFLVNISNDSWFGPTSAHYQHFAIAVFRCVETRRPLARAANTGISGFIDVSGRIVSQQPPFTEGIRLYRLPVEKRTTFYCLYGDLFALLCFPLCIILWICPRLLDPEKA